MREEFRLFLFEVVGSPFCVASGDGQKVFERLKTALEKDLKIALSFQNVKVLTSAFLNASIGQLYGIFSEEKIRSLVTVESIDQDDLALLKRVVENAKRYFNDSEGFNQIVEDSQEAELSEI